MNYWIFKFNPAFFDVDKHTQNGNPPLWWRVSRYRNEIMAGDMVFIWRAGPPRGIIAIANITSDPWYRPFDPNDPDWSDEYKVNIKVISKFPHLQSDFLKTIPGLEGLSTFHGYQATTNFKVSKREGEIISRIVTKERGVWFAQS